MAAIAASRLRALITLTVVAAVVAAASLALALAPASANATALPATSEQRCGWSSKAGAWHYLCYAPSTYYPNQTGRYAWVGQPGECGTEPFDGYLPLDDAHYAMCAVAPSYDGWAVRGGQWVKVRLSSGERGYIHPYSGSSAWRWVYVDRLQEWTAVKASEVGILWKLQ